MTSLSLKHLTGYGLMGLPLAFAALPVYVLAPKLYGETFGLGLALTGLVLFGARLVDTLQDPFLGRWLDQLQADQLRRVFILAAAILMVCFTGMFNPLPHTTMGLASWLAIMLIGAYTAHSILQIGLLAWGAGLANADSERTRFSAAREVAAVSGVVLASLAYAFLQNSDLGRPGFSALFVICLSVALVVLLKWAPTPSSAVNGHGSFSFKQMWLPLKQAYVRRLVVIFWINGLGISIAASLSLFYIGDTLHAEHLTGPLLATYFVCGALSLPFWVRVSDRMGLALTWKASMVLSAIAFLAATQLGAGDIGPFILICCATGFALGADLALPPVLLAKGIPPTQAQLSGLYYGIWNLASKLSLAIAAGLGLPLLAWLGYQPGDSATSQALPWVYAGVPCLLKLIAAALLHYSPVITQEHTPCIAPLSAS